MNGRIVWKLLATLLVAAWALSALLPLESQEFESFIASKVAANKTEFDELSKKARGLVATGEQPAYFLALKEIARREQIDLQAQFFPGIKLSTRNLERRNDSLLRYLVKESKSALKLGLDLNGGTAVTFRIDEVASSKAEAQGRLEKAVEIMRKRVDGLGVAEPVIRPMSTNQLEVQMPGLDLEKDPDSIESLGKAARLDFRLVWTGGEAPADAVPGSFRVLPENPRNPDSLPVRYEVMVEERENPKTGEIIENKWYVKQKPEFSGKVKSAGVYMDQVGRNEIGLRFTDEGGELFASLTRKMAEVDRSVGQTGFAKSGIVLDNKLYSVLGLATDQPITGGSASISGTFSDREALELANVLNNPLEFDLVKDDVSVVTPNLAQDARSSSIMASVIGAAMVVALMVVYYRVPGVLSVVALAVNCLIILGSLASMEATLTLPGVAAMVLTIGMAVDANILIFERIREELNAGKSLKSAVEAGFDKVFSTILDANITTLITAVILFYMGSGPVRGFGITLAIGILSSIFAALVISRALIELLIANFKVKQLFPNFFKTELKMQAMSFARPAFIVSWTLVAAGVVALCIRGEDTLGIDFLGGAEVTYTFTDKDALSTKGIMEMASSKNLGEVLPSFQTLLGEGAREVLKLQVDNNENRIDEVTVALLAQFPDAGIVKVAQNQIGATVSSAITVNAAVSVVLALVAILLYVALRFEFGYGVGAVVSTVHDVLMTVGLFVLLGMFGIGSGQFTAPMVAAILTIMGYSINDTIVVFDRIREELQLRPELTLREVINLSVNRTFSRTTLTSLSTLFAALSLFIFGAGVIQDYALIFIIGIITGTFSSIFIASPVFYWWHKGSRKHVEEREWKRPTYEWETGSSRSDSTPAS